MPTPTPFAGLSRWRSIATLLALALMAGWVQGAEFWVSPQGNDANPGTPEAPLATVAMAQRKVREVRRLATAPLTEPQRIVVRGGTYRLVEPLFFRTEDSGTAASPTEVVAAAGELPILSGGVAVTGWVPLREPVAGLPASAVGQVWVADAPRVGGRQREFRQLWVGTTKAVRARTPNGETMSRLKNWDVERREAVLPVTALPAGDVSRMEMVLYQQWEVAFLRVASLRTDGEESRITFHEPESRVQFEHPWPGPIIAPEKGYTAPYFLVNAAAFLDEPGEWFHDMERGRVYYWPRTDEDLAKAEVTAPVLEQVVEIEGSPDLPVEYVRFEGLAFAHGTFRRPSEAGHVPLQAGMYLIDAYKLKPKGAWGRRNQDNLGWIGRPPALVEAVHTRALRFDRCRFERSGSSGLDVMERSRDVVVEGCVFRDLGGNGLQHGSFQDGGVETHRAYDPADTTVLCTNTRIANNYFNDCASEDWGCVAIALGFTRNAVVEHNEITNCSYSGISIGWAWTPFASGARDNQIRANLIHRVSTRMYDTAGIYLLGAQPGTVISENFIHTLTMSPHTEKPHWGYVYLDEGASYVVVKNNASPDEKFVKNANGTGNVWELNGPAAPAGVVENAGLEPAFQGLRGTPPPSDRL